MKGANTIIIKNVVFDTVVKKLLDSGYFIEKSDTIFGTIITIPKPLKDDNVIIQVRIKDSTATLTGRFNNNTSITVNGITVDNKNYMSIENKGMKGSSYNKTWDALNKFSLLLGVPEYYKN